MKIIQNKAINKYILTAISILGILLILLVKVPSYVEGKKLESLGYDKPSIQAIRQKKLNRYILKNSLYSDYLKEEVVKDSFKSDYIDLYTVTNPVTDESTKLYNALLIKGYQKKDALTVFKSLKSFEIIALLAVDFQDEAGLTTFIEDCLAHPENSQNSFKLSGQYINPEKIYEHDFSIDILVNNNNKIKESAAINLVPMSLNYATEGLKAEEEAYRHFTVMVDAMATKQLKVYAIEAYRDFETQKNYFEEVKQAEKLGISKPGHSDFNTGLAFQLVGSGSSFKSSAEYQWLKDNAANYGFIFRFPEGKEYLTGKDEYSNLIRYVGKEAAEIMKAEGLCFEEYHALYLDNNKK